MQVGSFISVLVWAALAASAVLRLRRNQIERAGSGLFADSATSTSDYKPFSNPVA